MNRMGVGRSGRVSVPYLGAVLAAGSFAEEARPPAEAVRDETTFVATRDTLDLTWAGEGILKADPRTVFRLTPRAYRGPWIVKGIVPDRKRVRGLDFLIQFDTTAIWKRITEARGERNALMADVVAAHGRLTAERGREGGHARAESIEAEGASSWARC